MLPNSQWLITTVSAPMTFNRGTDETWLLNPVRRYVLNIRHVEKLRDNIETLSDLPGSPHYRPLLAGRPLNGARVFIERFRDRGLGDLLFLTGPMAFMHHVTGGNVRLHTYAFSDRGAILQNCPYLEHGTVYVGPTHYDDFQGYDFQWLVASATESNEEADQLNVYDALYKEIGLRPEQVDPKFKRPHVQVSVEELDSLNSFFHTIWSECQIDLRRGYYVLAPLTHSALRAAPYQLWLDLAKYLSGYRPVIFIGQTSIPLPDLDIPAGVFVTKTLEMGPQVMSLMGDRFKNLNLRSIVSIISQASALIGLDSGPLYIAQGCRVPAVSLWGPHDPGVRIGYDPDYMDLAVWNQAFCRQSPCFAYGQFPVRKCPDGPRQKICQCLRVIQIEDVLKQVEKIEARRIYSLGAFRPKNEKPVATEAAPDTAA